MKKAKNFFILSIPQMLGLWLLVCLCALPLFAQNKPESKTESFDGFGKGGKVTSTYTDTEDGKHIVEKQYFPPKSPMKKKEVETSGKDGKTIEIEMYGEKGETTYREKVVTDTNGNEISKQTEYYKDGVLDHGVIVEKQSDGSEKFKKFNRETGVYDDLTAEQFYKMFTDEIKKLILKEKKADKSNESPSNKIGYNVETATYNGINNYTFLTPNGKVEVNLPDDMAAGDTITGTVSLNPSGKTKEEIAKNESELKKLLIELPGNGLISLATEKLFNLVVPHAPTKENCHLSLLKDKKPVSTTTVPPAAKQPQPENFSTPTG
jgi:hypothetical protein